MTRQHAGMPSSGLPVPGRNCWRIEHSDRLAFLIDGAAYFAAVRSAIAQAKRSVFILAGDFDSRIRLVPQSANDGYPEELGEFLKEVVRRQPDLRMCILSWDFVFVFAGNREFIPLYKLGWRTHPRPRLAPPGRQTSGQRLASSESRGGGRYGRFVGSLDLTHGLGGRTPLRSRRSYSQRTA
jgi:hypothetical protein